MKKFFIIFFALVLGVVGGYFAYKYFAVQNKANAKSLASYDEPFQWGVTMGAADLGRYIPEIWQKQINVAKKLGVGWVRMNWDFKNPDPLKRDNEEIVKYLLDNNLQVMMIVQQDPRKTNIDDYKDGYNDGYDVASRYKGKIHFYQMINEGGSTSIKQPTMNGQTEDQYDEAKYKKVSDYLKGLSDGIAKADPDAWRIVSLAHTYTGYLDKLVKDNVPFDMIGIDWYGWMGPIDQKKMDNGQMFVDKLKSYNKPLMVTETNADSKGKIVYEDKQSEFISQMATWAWQNKDYVKGFYVLSLFDGLNNPDPSNVEYFGIVQAKQSSSGTNVPGDPRKAYYTYQDIIKKYLGQ